MHEMALTSGVLRILEDQARTHGVTRIRTVWLEVGALSHAEPDSLRFCFEAAIPGTVAEGARLEILRPPGQAWCMDCAGTVEIPERIAPCPVCGGHKLQVTGGEELRVKELEVD